MGPSHGSDSDLRTEDGIISTKVHSTRYFNPRNAARQKSLEDRYSMGKGSRVPSGQKTSVSAKIIDIRVQLQLITDEL